MVSLSTGKLSAWIQEWAGWERGQWCKAVGAQHMYKQQFGHQGHMITSSRWVQRVCYIN